MRRRVKSVVGEAIDEGRAAHVSVYFRDLGGGTWFSVNPVERFVPASLLKLPVLMALVREGEGDPMLLPRRVRSEGREDLTRDQSVKPVETLQPGRDYPLGELARRTVVHSANNAARLVLDALPAGSLDRLYGELGVSFSGGAGDESFLSVDAYASFFRILYNSTSLERKSSEAILALVAGRSFDGGLRAGVPASVTVAAKFGEWRLHREEGDREQFHDCGIVYHPERPCLLCVMTRGPLFEPLTGVVGDVSRAVFEEVDGAGLLRETVAGLPSAPPP